MSKPVHLYRAVNAEPITISPEFDEDEPWTEPAGAVVFGRQSGYLSRSGAVEAGRNAGIPFEIVRSEPVVFLTTRERLEREIDRLRAELAATL